MEALLKVAEAAALQGVSVRWVQKKAREGHYTGIQVRTNAQNRPEYLIPLTSLPESSQRKYIEQHRPVSAAPALMASKSLAAPAARPLESYSGEERAEISYWLAMVDRWQQYRNKAGGRKAECDEKFVLLCQLEEPERQISVETLYRKWAAIRAGDWDALVDKRGKARKGQSVLPPEVEQYFLSLYLDGPRRCRCRATTRSTARRRRCPTP